MKIEIWADIVCPWCYIGSRNVHEALAAFDGADTVEVAWKAFELSPNAPRDGGGTYVDRLSTEYRISPEEAMDRLGHSQRAAAAVGLDLRYDVALPANSFDAHRLLHLAAERGLHRELQDRLFAAVFTEGLSIGDPATLVELAAGVGIPEADAEEAVRGDAFADQVRADEAKAREIGVGGVPFYLVDGRYALSGAQPATAIVELLERAAHDARPIGVGDHAGDGAIRD